MQSILEQITDWLKSMIISGIMGNLSGMFDSVNQQVGQIAGDVGTTPANFSPVLMRQMLIQKNGSVYLSNPPAQIQECAAHARTDQQQAGFQNSG